MSDYTPTTPIVRHVYAIFNAPEFDQVRRREFDAWFAEEIRKAKEEAWDEGEADGVYNEINRHIARRQISNPYRREDA